MNSEASLIWIRAGYELFALEGKEGVQIEKLARKIGRNKSGLYHHFGDLDIFFSEMIQHHILVMDQYCHEISRLKQFDPDYLKVLIKYKHTAFVQMQLRKNLDNPVFKEAFHQVRRKTEKGILAIWSDFIKIPDNPSLALQLWDILRDLFFIRLNVHSLTLEFLQELVEDFTKIIDSVRHTRAIPLVPPVSRNRGPFGL
jgi:AcrR family transcriptional regulator